MKGHIPYGMSNFRAIQSGQFENKKAEAIKQLREYVASDDNLKKKTNLQAYAVLFVGQRGTVIDVRDERVIYSN